AVGNPEVFADLAVDTAPMHFICIEQLPLTEECVYGRIDLAIGGIVVARLSVDLAAGNEDVAYDPRNEQQVRGAQPRPILRFDPVPIASVPGAVTPDLIRGARHEDDPELPGRECN